VENRVDRWFSGDPGDAVDDVREVPRVDVPGVDGVGEQRDAGAAERMVVR
jgi:hypothetical protein